MLKWHYKRLGKGEIIKLLIYIGIPIMIVLGAFYYLFHTASGLGKVSQILSEKVSKLQGEKIDLHVTSMAFSPSQIEAVIMINKHLTVQLQGYRKPLSGYEITYHAYGDGIDFSAITLDDDIDIVGRIVGDREDYRIQGEGKALEGDVAFSWRSQKTVYKDINITLKHVRSAKLQTLLGKKPLLAGALSLQAHLPLYAPFEKKGEVFMDIHKSGVYLQHIKEIFGVQLPDDFMLKAKLHIYLNASNKHQFDADINTTLANITLHRGRFIESNHKLNALYKLHVPALEKWAFLSGKTYAGVLDAEGELEYLDGLRFDGQTDSLGGRINYYYEKRTLEAGLHHVKLEKLFSMLRYPTIMIGDIDGKVNYDFTHNIAILNIQSQDVHFKKSRMIEKIQRASGVDLSQELFTRSTFSSSVDDGIVSYDFRASNDVSYLALLNSRMDARENSIEADFDLRMQEQELSGHIYGSLRSPQVQLNIGKYLEYKAKKEIDEFFGDGTTQKLKKKLKEVDIKDVKGLIKSFF